MHQRPIPVAVHSKDYVWNSLIPGFAGSKPAKGMDIRLVCLLCVV